MNDLIALSQQYAAQDSQVCDKCNTPLKLRTQIVDARQILVLKLDVQGKVVPRWLGEMPVSILYQIVLSKLVIKCLPCNQVYIFCLTKVLAFLT